MCVTSHSVNNSEIRYYSAAHSTAGPGHLLYDTHTDRHTHAQTRTDTHTDTHTHTNTHTDTHTNTDTHIYTHIHTHTHKDTHTHTRVFRTICLSVLRHVPLHLHDPSAASTLL